MPTPAELFDELTEIALDELEDKQNVLPAPDPQGSWRASTETGLFEMLDSQGRVTVTARMQFLGTWSNVNGWLWAWANDSLDAPMRSAVEAVRRHGQEHGIEELSEPRVRCDDNFAVVLFAIAIHLTAAQTAYRYPLSETSTAWLALFDVRATNKE